MEERFGSTGWGLGSRVAFDFLGVFRARVCDGSFLCPEEEKVQVKSGESSEALGIEVA